MVPYWNEGKGSRSRSRSIGSEGSHSHTLLYIYNIHNMKENNEQQQSFQEETLQILLAKSIGMGD